MHQAVQRLPLGSAANEMHTCLEAGTTTGETLQTATHLRGLLQNGDIIAILGKDDTARKAAEATAYDEYFGHCVIEKLKN